MQSKLLSLVIGFVLAFVAVIASVMLVGRAEVQTATTVDDTSLTQISTSDIVGKTDGLVNYGDLPKIVTKEDLERSNPFEAY